MVNVRCNCGKIVCQLENLPDWEVADATGTANRTPCATAPPQTADPAIVILCRHCKSYVILEISGLQAIRSRPALGPAVR